MHAIICVFFLSEKIIKKVKLLLKNKSHKTQLKILLPLVAVISEHT